MTTIQPKKLNLKKSATATYDRLLVNGRTETGCTLDCCEELFDVAQELFEHGIRFLGLNPKDWEPTGRVTQVIFKHGDDGEYSLQWELTRTVMDGEFSEEQSFKTSIFDYRRLARYPEVYAASENIQRAIVRVAESQPIQGTLFSPKLEVVA